MGIVEESTLGVIPIGGWTSSFQDLGFQADGSEIEFPWIGDRIVEWDKDTKEIIWSWSVFDHFSMDDYDEYGGTWNQAFIDLQYDWTHVNAVIFDEDESAIYISWIWQLSMYIHNRFLQDENRCRVGRQC
mgnify:CR=1 FL=1